MKYDPYTEERLKLVHPLVGDQWRGVQNKLWEKYALQLRVADGYRDHTQQWAIFAKGRIKEGKTWVIVDEKQVKTRAQPGSSYHNFGLAIDSCFVRSHPYLEDMPEAQAHSIWTDYGIFCTQMGLTWGGFWKHPDIDHCENSFKLGLNEIQMLYEQGGIPLVWEKCGG